MASRWAANSSGADGQVLAVDAVGAGRRHTQIVVHEHGDATVRMVRRRRRSRRGLSVAVGAGRGVDGQPGVGASGSVEMGSGWASRSAMGAGPAVGVSVGRSDQMSSVTCCAAVGDGVANGDCRARSRAECAGSSGASGASDATVGVMAGVIVKTACGGAPAAKMERRVGSAGSGGRCVAVATTVTVGEGEGAMVSAAG